MTSVEKRDLFILLNALREEIITDEQFAELDKILVSNKQAQLLYVQYAKMCSELSNFQEASGNVCPEILDKKEESDSPLSEIIIQQHQEIERLDQYYQELQEKKQARLAALGLDKEKPKDFQRGKIQFISVCRVIGAIAAMLFIALLLTMLQNQMSISKLDSISPPPRYVATVTDSLNALWAGPEQFAINDKLSRGAKYLEQGFVEITFADNVEVVLEAPCKFDFDNKSRLIVNSGNISANVPKGSEGFKVITPYATIMDLGTEFAVSVQQGKRSEVHVFQGEVKLFAGAVGEQTNQIKITQGNASYVEANSEIIKKTAYRKDLFVRHINSDTQIVWRSEQLDLADVIAGGNGFGTGDYSSGINPLTGERITQISFGDRYSNNEYNAVVDLPFVDGIFVPDGELGPVEVTSTGLSFDGIGDTTGLFFADLNNRPMMAFDDGTDALEEMTMDQMGFSSQGQTLISMHANLGITFDLDEVRNAIPNVKLEKFTALAGLSDSLLSKEQLYMSDEKYAQTSPPMANFYVLVDGQVRFGATNVTPKQLAKQIDIQLTSDDRFLTLIATDANMTHGQSWCIFAMPALIFE